MCGVTGRDESTDGVVVQSVLDILHVTRATLSTVTHLVNTVTYIALQMTDGTRTQTDKQTDRQQRMTE